MEVAVKALLFILGSMAIWVGAGFIINSVQRLSTKLNISPFIISFFILSFMTSSPEISIGINALRDHEPEIFIGNLLGGTIVIFFLIIPIFGILNNGVSLNHELNKKNLILTLSYIVLPILLFLDGKASIGDALILIFYYICILLIFYRARDRKEDAKLSFKKIEDLKVFKEFIFIIVGVVLVLFSSNLLVEGIEFFATKLKLSEMVLSLLVLSVGTNIPELTIAIRSIYGTKKEIAFGNYLGSAAVNSFMLGIFVLLSGNVKIVSSIIGISIMMIVGTILFYIFIESKNTLSRIESLVLLFFYFIFVLNEIIFKL